MSGKPASLAAALAQLQTDLPHILKSADAQYGKYADLAAITKQIMPKLGELGLAFTARPTLSGTAGFVLMYSLLHESGESLEGEYPLPGMEKGPQALGSAITYARRYALCAVTGVAPDADDDDAAAAQQAERKPRASRAQAPGKPQMTPQQQAEHDQLRDGTVEGRVNGATSRAKGPASDGDLWAGQPAGHLDTSKLEPEDRPGTCDGKQRKDISTALTTLGITDRAAQIDRIERVITRRLNGPHLGEDGTTRTRKNLSWQEAQDVKRDLAEAIKAKRVAERAAERQGAGT